MKNKAIFLDRDGVINKKMQEGDYVKNYEEFEFIPEAIEFLKLISKSDYNIFIITNQRGIALGIMSENDLFNIHNQMQKEFQYNGISIKKIYYCAHNYSDNCDCRKPKPGMLIRAEKEYSINLSKSFMIGDGEKDIETGKNAGCTTILLDTEYNNIDSKIHADFRIKSLLEAIEIIKNN